MNYNTIPIESILIYQQCKRLDELLAPSRLRKHTVKSAVDIAQDLRRGLQRLSFKPPVAHVYNPLEYAWDAHAEYLDKYAMGSQRVMFLGMNPGPFGMSMTNQGSAA